jgi:putative lipoprotein
MKRYFALIFILISFSSAQENQIDSSVTRIKIADVKYYDVKTHDIQQGIDHEKSDRPFALQQPTDKWFSKDKWMHLSTAYFLTLQSSFALEKMFFVESENSRQISLGISLSFSLGKEFYDVFSKKSIFSWKDLAYDIIGGGLGYLTATAIQK